MTHGDDRPRQEREFLQREVGIIRVLYNNFVSMRKQRAAFSIPQALVEQRKNELALRVEQYAQKRCELIKLCAAEDGKDFCTLCQHLVAADSIQHVYVSGWYATGSDHEEYTNELRAVCPRCYAFREYNKSILNLCGGHRFVFEVKRIDDAILVRYGQEWKPLSPDAIIIQQCDPENPPDCEKEWKIPPDIIFYEGKLFID